MVPCSHDWAVSCLSTFCFCQCCRYWVSCGPHILGWMRPSLLGLSNLAGPNQHFGSAILDAWRSKVSADLSAREGFRGGPSWILLVLSSSQSRLMSGKEIRHCFAVFWLGVFVTGFYCRVFGVSSFFVASVGILIGVGNCFGIFLLLTSVKILNFTISEN